MRIIKLDTVSRHILGITEYSGWKGPLEEIAGIMLSGVSGNLSCSDLFLVYAFLTWNNYIHLFMPKSSCETTEKTT